MSNYYEKLKKGLTGAVTVAAGAVSRAAEVAKDIAEDLTSFKALKDYKLAGLVATAGPGNTWRIFKAVNKKPGAVFPEASVWILDKKGLTDQASRAGRARGFDNYFEQQRRSCNQMLRIKHPGVIKVLEPLEETNTQMVIVTEPVFGSLHNIITQFTDVPTAPDDRTAVILSPLEVKYGLFHLSETLQFLHHEAKLAHCNMNPSAVIVTQDGSWKLAGFEFVSSIAEFGGSGGAAVVFEYSSACPSPWEEYSQPRLGFTAPELVGGCLASSDVVLSGAADCFSLAALAYQLIKGKQLLPVGSSTGDYRSRLSGLSSVDMSGVAGPLQPLLRAMLSTQASARPNAAAFSSCQWFSEDMLLRCLQFLDNIIQRESSQKVAFLKDVMTFWQQFDDRLLQHRVLPPIVQEMRNDMVALAALPVVLAIMGRMRPEGFAASGILPVLRPIFEHADGEVLLALVRHLHVFYNLMPSDAHGSVLVPLMLRAFDSNNTKAQEETLKALQKLAPDMPYQLLRDSLMPRVVGLCLRTTSLVVRTSSLTLMAQAAHRLDKEAAATMLDVCVQIVAVDRSAGTAMAVLRLGDTIGKHYGPELTATKVLPLLCPLLVSPGLNAQQFNSYVTAIRSLVDSVAEKTGSSLAAAAAAEPGTGVRRSESSSMVGTPSSSTGSGGGGRVAAAGSLFSADWSSSATTNAAAGGVNNSSSSNSLHTESWTSASSTPHRTSSSTPTAAAAAAAGASWSSAAWSSSSSMNTSSSMNLSSSNAVGWGSSVGSHSPYQQQQQQRKAAVSGVGTSSSMLAPDLFSSSGAAAESSLGLGDAMSGLGISGQQQLQPAWMLGGTTSSSSSSMMGNGSNNTDLFTGLTAPNTTGSSQLWQQQQQQQQQQQRSSITLQPPPSATRGISVLGGGVNNSSSSIINNSSSNSKDPFAGLSTPAASRPVASSPAGSSMSSGFDPFSTLAAAPPTAAAGGGKGGDPFADLVGGSGGSSINAARQRQQQQQHHGLAGQQQQQSWQGGGGSLI